MEMCAAQAGLRILEVPVDHRRCVGGQSNVSGNLKGTILAGAGILITFVRIAWNSRSSPAKALPSRSVKSEKRDT
jgi:hypothetical protein